MCVNKRSVPFTQRMRETSRAAFCNDDTSYCVYRLMSVNVYIGSDLDLKDSQIVVLSEKEIHFFLNCI